ncbi:MAG TPA: alpha/beta hydrolase [Bordetella sp.]|nr:alpha/beta hydrolase [Bordetella sp.]
MPAVRISPDLEMFYVEDNYTDPWSQPETVLMLHGLAESHESWYGWVPHLARDFRIIRPDLRGFGKSTPMPEDFPWTMDIVVDDLLTLMTKLGVERFHLVAAKIGGSVARYLAARFPDRVLSLTVAGTPPPFRDTVQARAVAWGKQIREEGVEGWARATMGKRLGDGFPDEGTEWWSKLMGRTAASTLLGSVLPIPATDLRPELPKIKCPTLVIVSDESTVLGDTGVTESWQRQIPNSRLLTMPGNSYHVAASQPDACARETLKFIRAHSKTAPPAR